MSDEERVALEATLRAQRRIERRLPPGNLYDPEFILRNPIPARCATCGYPWTERDAIKSPTLRNCACFWCQGSLVALDQGAYADRLSNLHLHIVPFQPPLVFT